MKEITVKVKSIYGVDKIYPVDDDSRTFARLAGTTTLTDEAIRHIKALGYTVKVQQEVTTL